MMRGMNRTISVIPTIPMPRMRSFAALMEVYEANFILLRRLMPQMTQMTGFCCHEDGSINEARDIHVRIYHDARVAEAVAGRLRGRDCVAMGRQGERCLDVRWRLNRFLYKWLRYTLHRQYDFTE